MIPKQPITSFRLLFLLGLVYFIFFLDTGLGTGREWFPEDHQKIADSKTSQDQQINGGYTAYNIFYWKPSGIFFINYKIFRYQKANILPAGTKITNLNIQRHDGTQGIPGLSFKANGKTFDLQFNARWHPGQSPESYARKMFSPKNFDELTAGMSEAVIDGIRRGSPIEGMTKAEVIIAFGYPPEHVTKSLEAKRWVYWMSRARTVVICFDQNDIAVKCSGPKDLVEW